MKIQVMDVSEKKKLTLKQAVLRESIYIVVEIVLLVSLFLVVLQTGRYQLTGTTLLITTAFQYASLGWFLIEIISLWTNKKRRSVQDYLADSVVLNIL